MWYLKSLPQLKVLPQTGPPTKVVKMHLVFSTGAEDDDEQSKDASSCCPSSWLKEGISFSLPTTITWRLSAAAGEGWCLSTVWALIGVSASLAEACSLWEEFSVEELSFFFFRNSSLLLASRLRVEGVFFFLWVAKTSFPLVSTEKEKLDPMFKEKENVGDLPASIWQNSRHLDASLSSSSQAGIAAIFTAYF